MKFVIKLLMFGAMVCSATVVQAEVIVMVQGTPEGENCEVSFSAYNKGNQAQKLYITQFDALDAKTGSKLRVNNTVASFSKLQPGETRKDTLPHTVYKTTCANLRIQIGTPMCMPSKTCVLQWKSEGLAEVGLRP